MQFWINKNMNDIICINLQNSVSTPTTEKSRRNKSQVVCLLTIKHILVVTERKRSDPKLCLFDTSQYFFITNQHLEVIYITMNKMCSSISWCIYFPPRWKGTQIIILGHRWYTLVCNIITWIKQFIMLLPCFNQPLHITSSFYVPIVRIFIIHFDASLKPIYHCIHVLHDEFNVIELCLCLICDIVGRTYGIASFKFLI